MAPHFPVLFLVIFPIPPVSLCLVCVPRCDLPFPFDLQNHLKSYSSLANQPLQFKRPALPPRLCQIILPSGNYATANSCFAWGNSAQFCSACAPGNTSPSPSAMSSSVTSSRLHHGNLPPSRHPEVFQGWIQTESPTQLHIFPLLKTMR